MKTKPFQARQGDILIERIGPAKGRTTKPVKVILALGEATGHNHAITGCVVAETEPSGLLKYKTETKQNAPIQVSEIEILEAMAELLHEEHAAIPHSRGTYRVIRQREYSPEEIRSVAD